MSDAETPETPIPGLMFRVTPRGFLHVRLEHRADPAKDNDKWLEWARATVPTDRDFRREYLLDWTTGTGDVFFPEFAEIGREHYVYNPKSLIAGPVYRGWDFGVRGPVCVWFQYSQASDRVYVLREFAPGGYGKNANLAAHYFRDICRWASGQFNIMQLQGPAREWADFLLKHHSPAPPWFGLNVTFQDHTAKHEISARQSIAAKDPMEATLAQVWAAGGIDLMPQTGPIKGREIVLRRLLGLRQDGWPGILIHESCTETLAMLDGGLVYKSPSKMNPKPDAPKKDGRFDNVYDALTYGLVAVVGVDPPAPYVHAQTNVGWSWD